MSKFDEKVNLSDELKSLKIGGILIKALLQLGHKQSSLYEYFTLVRFQF
jgi:hypothetical protein